MTVTSTARTTDGPRCVVADLTCQSCNRLAGEIGGTVAGRSLDPADLHFRPAGGRWHDGGVPSWRCARCGGRLLLDSVSTFARRADTPPPWGESPISLAELPPERRTRRPNLPTGRGTPRRDATPVPLPARLAGIEAAAG